MHLRNPAFPLEALQLSDFGLLHNGCRVTTPAVTTMVNGSVTLRFEETVTADGYYLVTSDASAAADPVGWVVESAVEREVVQGSDIMQEWRVVGASVWRFSYAGTARYYPHLPHDMPDARRMAIIVDHRRTWLWALASVAGNGVTAAAFILCFLGGIAGRVWITLPLLVGMFWLRAIANMVAAVGFQVIHASKPVTGTFVLLRLSTGDHTGDHFKLEI